MISSIIPIMLLFVDVLGLLMMIRSIKKCNAENLNDKKTECILSFHLEKVETKNDRYVTKYSSLTVNFTFSKMDCYETRNLIPR